MENRDQLQLNLMQLARVAFKAGIKAKEFERICYRQFLLEALDACNLNICKTSLLLDVHRNTLARQLDELKINMADLRALRAGRRKPVASDRPSNFVAMMQM